MCALQVSQERLYLEPTLPVSFQATRIVSGPLTERRLSLGALPVRLARDYSKSPAAWSREDGAFVPVAPGLTFWLGLYNEQRVPHALLVKIDGRNAVTGVSGDGLSLHPDPQNYLVAPPQSALYGVRTGSGVEPFTIPKELLELHGFAQKQPQLKPGTIFPHWDAIASDTFGCDTWDPASACRAQVYFITPEQFYSITGDGFPVFTDRGDPTPLLP